MPRHIVFTVINDLNYDQRMQRICTSLANHGYKVTLIGRKKVESPQLKSRNFRQIRMRLLFSSGKLFYVEYNFRLLLHFFLHRYDIHCAIDLDTILPQYVAAKFKDKPFVYDAHEYFSELPEVVHRPFVKWIWRKIEAFTIPRTRYAYTVNQSIADFFKEKYDTEFEVIRSVTVFKELPIPPKTETYILYQGAVNVGRGIEEMITAMQYIDCKLYICGNGDVYDDCVQLSKDLGVADKVTFFGRVEPDKLRQITLGATLGFTFFTKQGMSYHYSLANRFFDYFHAGVPQLCVNYPEYQRINRQVEVALLLDDLAPENIAKAANKLLNDQALYNQLRENCLLARQVINWQQEEKKLVAIYDGIV